MRSLSRRTLVIAAPLAAVGACAQKPARTDAAIIDMLRNDRPGFEEAVRRTSMNPPIRRLRMRRGAIEADPADISPQRRQWLADFMARHDLVGIDHHDGGVRFIVSASGLGVSGGMKSLEFEPTGRITENGAGALVDDTDRAVAAHKTESVLAYRDIGDGWFIRNSA